MSMQSDAGVIMSTLAIVIAYLSPTCEWIVGVAPLPFIYINCKCIFGSAW